MRVKQTRPEAEATSDALLAELGVLSVGKDSPELHRWLGEKLSAGVPIAHLNRLPEGVAAYVRMCMKDEGGYAAMERFNLKVRFRNVSAFPLSVVTKNDRHVPRVSQQRGGIHVYVDGGTERITPHYVTVAPGDEIEIGADFALHAMYSHSQSAWSPDLWDESGAIPRGDALLEVGYRCEIDGETVVIDHEAKPEVDTDSEPTTRRRGRPPKTEARAEV